MSNRAARVGTAGGVRVNAVHGDDGAQVELEIGGYCVEALTPWGRRKPLTVLLSAAADATTTG